MNNVTHGEIRRILVVEDDVGLNKLSRKKLEHEGFKTIGLTTGKEALDILKEDQDFLLVLDYILPDMTGEEVIKNLIENDKPVPFIMMSGKGSERIAVDMMKLGAKDYIVKDTSFLEFLPRVVKQVADAINTERILATTVQTLKESEDKYRTLIEDAQDGIYIIQKKRFVYVNSAFCRMFGYQKEELLGMENFMELVDEESHDYIREQAKNWRNEENFSTKYEFMGKTKAGGTLYLDVNIGQIMYEGKKARQGILRDITERKLAEEKHQELEKVKSDFMLLVSHELGTPLMVIELFLESLMTYGDDLSKEEKDNSFEKIQLNMDRIKKLKQFMSNMMILEQGKFQPNKEPLFLQHIAYQAMEELKPLADKKEIELIFDLQEFDIVLADIERIHDVLSTLIDNAIRYTPVGGRIEISGRQDDGSTEIMIKDNGIGIASWEQERIFERFYQIEDILQHKDGFGLGLSIAKGIIQSHGGEMWVESQPRKGSTFHFTLPKKDPETDN